ncbi:replicative DNA helicase [Mycoplasmopsis pullorum]|nr:replicative DNA helicase [Mycoplasmopsis pullorum]TNK82760.1 replicative DNA helicase [Mycoplasmopsis pullorum]TNK83911.1 replicative DNA helicase [Mycoplasmopsis pullorum]TNK84619.1 replicative DNA helicase [Mycoplasmopsis pullorum]TNK86300.1 replicative DNA helicase [Mycoplasmopsis pullorum]TNK86704.1 replicative DNA helicase [Mycoplasmopsis pullorum]
MKPPIQTGTVNNHQGQIQNFTFDTSKLHDIELEEKILGMILANVEILHESLMYLSEEDFYFIDNKNLFLVFKQLQNRAQELKTININDVFTFIERNFNENHTRKITLSFLSKIALKAGNYDNKLLYFEELTKLTSLRKIYSTLVHSLNKLNNPANLEVKDFAAEIEAQITEANSNRSLSSFTSISDAANEYIRDLQYRRNLDENHLAGVPSGIHNLDIMTQGFKSGELIILAARPAMGKTAFALNICVNAALSNRRVAFFSLEMSNIQLMSRIFSIVSGVEGNKLKKASLLDSQDWTRLSIAKQTKIDQMNFFIDDSSSSKIAEIAWKARRLKKLHNIDLIVVDYLQLMTGSSRSNDNRQNEVSKISRTLKELSRELEIPIIALSQLSRSVEQREDKRPILSDLRESGSIEQDADMVMFLYRNDYYQKKQNERISDEIGSETDLIIAKHRSGPTGSIKLRFNMSISRFSDPVVSLNNTQLFNNNNK